MLNGKIENPTKIELLNFFNNLQKSINNIDVELRPASVSLNTPYGQLTVAIYNTDKIIMNNTNDKEDFCIKFDLKPSDNLNGYLYLHEARALERFLGYINSWEIKSIERYLNCYDSVENKYIINFSNKISYEFDFIDYEQEPIIKGEYEHE